MSVCEFHNSNHRKILSVQINTIDDIYQSMDKLDLIYPAKVIVLVGGASNIDENYIPIISQVADVIAKVADEVKAVVIDGGTNSGIMASIGKSRRRGGYKFPLVGIAVEKLVAQSILTGESDNYRKQKRVALEPNHSHYILVPGYKWGDESHWISDIASLVSKNKPSVTVLMNGGEISHDDIGYSIDANRPIVVLEGTGRLADEIARKNFLPKIFNVVPAIDDILVAETIKRILSTGNISSR